MKIRRFTYCKILQSLRYLHSINLNILKMKKSRMKKSLQIMFILLIGLSLVFTSCKKDEDEDTSNAAEFLTCKIDGSSFSAAQDPSVIVGAQINSGVLAVHGGTNTGETIRLTAYGYNGVGTYHAGDSFTNSNSLMYVSITPVATWSTLFDGTSGYEGDINVTSDDGTTIEGTFSFSGYDAQSKTVKTISEGKFKALID